jgi:hypothetical protein
MRQRTTHCPVHLGHATQAICVLNSRIIREMRLTDLAAFHQRQKMRGYGFLT